MPHYVQSDGPSIQERGDQAVKEPHPVFLVESDAPFSVSTNEGTLNGNAGDYLAYDPQSGHVWPVSAEYVDMHYRWLEEGEEVGQTKRQQEWTERLQELEDARSELQSHNEQLLAQIREYESQNMDAKVPEQPTGE